MIAKPLLPLYPKKKESPVLQKWRKLKADLSRGGSGAGQLADSSQRWRRPHCGHSLGPGLGPATQECPDSSPDSNGPEVRAGVGEGPAGGHRMRKGQGPMEWVIWQFFSILSKTLSLKFNSVSWYRGQIQLQRQEQSELLHGDP